MPKLNARSVDTVREAGRYGDGDGLYLIVSDSGSKKWVLRYQQDGRRRDMGLGAYPEVPTGSRPEKANTARRAMPPARTP